MASTDADLIPKSDRWSYLWLVFGAVLLVFSSGKWAVPLAFWLSLVFLIRFMRTQKVLWGYVLLVVASVAAIVAGF